MCLQSYWGSKHDGDQLSEYANKDPQFHELFITMCPTYSFIDRATGKFNEGMLFKREYVAILGAAWDIDKEYDRYLNDPDGGSPEYGGVSSNGIYPPRKLGVDYAETAQEIEDRNSMLRRLAELNEDNPYRQHVLGSADPIDFIT